MRQQRLGWSRQRKRDTSHVETWKPQTESVYSMGSRGSGVQTGERRGRMKIEKASWKGCGPARCGPDDAQRKPAPALSQQIRDKRLLSPSPTRFISRR